MNKKGFTLIELLGVIVILIIMFALAFYSISRYLRVGRSKTLKSDIKTVEVAVRSAVEGCIKDPSGTFCTNHPTLNIGGEDTIYLSELVKNSNIEDIQSPYDGEICTGNIKVKRVESADPTNVYSFRYKVCLRCGSNKQAAVEVAKYMIESGATDEEIMNCVPISSIDLGSLR